MSFDDTTQTAASDFLADGGAMGQYIRTHDWAATPLGAPASWPQGLKTAVRTMLTTRHPMFIFWGEQHICLYNDGYSTSIGPEKHPSMLGTPGRIAWTETWDIIGPQIERVRRGEGATWDENRPIAIFRHGKLSEGYWTYSFGPIDDATTPNGIGGVLVVVTETTDQVLAERRRVAEAQRMMSMFDQAPGFMALLEGPEHRFTLTNRAYQTLVGGREVVGLPIVVALPEAADQGFVMLLDKVFETGEPYLGHGQTVQLQSPDTDVRETRVLDFVYQPIRDVDGAVSGVFVEGIDVTARVAAEVALAEETRILQILNQSGAAVAAELDIGTLVQRVTDAAVDITRAQFGAFFYNVLKDDGESYTLYALSGVPHSAFEGFPMPRATAIFGPTYRGESVVRSADIQADPRYGRNAPHHGMPAGHLPVRSYLAVPVVSRSGEVLGGLFFGHAETGRFSERHERLVVGIAAQAAVAIDNARLFEAAQREIVERERAEADLHELNETLESRVLQESAQRAKAEEALRQAQKMEAVGQLTGGIAHDFNNLLQVISGNLQLLAKDVEHDERAARRVHNAMAGVTRGSRLAAQLLAFGRRQALEPRVLNIGRLLRDTDGLLRRALGEAVEIETIVGGGLWNTLVDPGNIENALLNLAINARDAMNGRGKLTIEVSNAFLDDDYAASHDVDAGQYVLLAVSDTGAGMDAAIVERVFEPFFTTKPAGQGTGLGLSMVYGFVKQSGGHIKIYSEAGQGTTVKLYLPRNNEDEDLAMPTDVGPVAGGTETVLIAEDDEAVRETVAGMLADLGYNVLQARNAEGALSIVESGAAIDLLFTDVVMPGTMKSPDMARKAQQRLPRMAVLFTSGYTENAIVHGGRLDRGVELLGKPYTREALARKIRHVLANQKQRNPAIEPLEAPVAPAPKAAPLSLLLCEDDALIRTVVIDLLESRGYHVLEAENAREAIALHAANRVDVLVTDVNLPDMSGIELAAKLRESTPELPCVFATGHALSLDNQARTVAISKPYGLDQLLKAIAAVTGKS